jgi:hypothetical protein
MHPSRIATAVILALAMAACRDGVAEPRAESVALTVTGTETSPDGKMCAFDVTARNGTGRDAVNIQVAYTAETTSNGVQSEYIVLGDLAADEEKTGRLILTGAPCGDVQTLKLTRAVCTVSPVADPPESCADAVILDGGGVIEVPAG